MLKPLLDRVLVKMLENEESTQSGIILTAAKEKTQIAEVIEVGSGGEIDGKELKMYISKGDKVVLNKYSGTEIKHQGENFIIVNQSDILAIVD